MDFLKGVSDRMKKVFKDVIEVTVTVSLDTEALRKDCQTVYKKLKADYGGATWPEFFSKAINYIMDLHLNKYTFYNPDMLLDEKKEAFETIYRGIEEYVAWYWRNVIVINPEFEWSD